MIWPFNKLKPKRFLTQEEAEHYFREFMFREVGSTTELPSDIDTWSLHTVWIMAKDRQEKILSDIGRCGGTFPGAYTFPRLVK